jgi:hypothetical protein
MPFLCVVAALTYAFVGFGPISLDGSIGVTPFDSPRAI